MKTGGELVSHIMERFLTDIHGRVTDNHDLERHPQGHLSILPWLIQQSKVTFNLVINHSNELAEVYNLFSDDASRVLFLDLLAYRLAGPEHVKLRVNAPEHWDARRRAVAAVCGPSDLEEHGEFGRLSRFELDLLGHVIRLDCWPGSVAWSFFFRQYFFERNGVEIAPAVGDFIIDGGSCLGDTMLGFAAVAGEDGHVYGFDPCAGNLAVMRHNLAANPWARATIYPCGLSNRDQESESVPLPGISPGFSVDSVGSGTVPLRRIDTLVNTGLIQRVDFIKLDVEGSELATLLGAQDTLRRFTPKLAVSLYHRPNDLFTIPFYLRSLGLGYRFYLDHYTIHNEETVLYAMA